jgi:serine/threonine protein kinase/Tfp pilus assembly protein PilF
MDPEASDGGLDETRPFKVLSPGAMISHYKIIEKIGEGGMGVVYKAEDTKLKRHIALKFLPPRLLCDAEAKERFVHEAQAASSLEHPNICNIHEIGETEEGHVFICMACYDGETLKEKIERGASSVEEAVDIAIQAARGVTKAHEKGIVHRDMKPANIMITSDGVVKVMDFGLAKLAGQTRLTKTGTTVGTVAYMSPEQTRGQEVDHRTDIWSLGAVLYQMLTGRVPFKGEYEQAVIYSILNEEPEPVTSLRTGIPLELEGIISKALAKNPDERYQHVDEIRVDLERLKKVLAASGEIQPSRARVTDSSEKLVSERKPIAVVSFENQTGDNAYDYLQKAIPNLLITSLEQSKYLHVTTWERMHDLLNLLGKEDVEVIDKELGFELCSMDGVDAVVVGCFVKAGDVFATDAKVLDVKTKQIVKSTSSKGKGVSSVLDKQIDELSREITRGVGIPEPKTEAAQVGIADVTTPSMDAYRCYVEGLDYYYRQYRTEADRCFRRALDFDPTFAMAYYRLARPKRGSEGRELIAKAVECAAKASEKERLYIKGLEAFLSGNHMQAIREHERIVERYPKEKEAFRALGMMYYNGLGQAEAAIQNLNKAVELDPLHGITYDYLATFYRDIGDYEKSLWAINEYISVAPNDAAPYDTRAFIYATMGKIDQAIESYRKALEMKPDFYWSLTRLGGLYLMTGEYTEAEVCFQKLCSSPDKYIRSEGRVRLALIPLYQGKFEQAFKVLDDGITADRMDQGEAEHTALKYLLKASIYHEKKDLRTALVEFEKFLEIYQRVNPGDPVADRHYHIHLLSENNETEKAQEVANALKRDIDLKAKSSGASRWDALAWSYALGCIEMAKGNFDAAIANFERAAEDDMYGRRFPWARYILASTHLEAGRLGEAVGEFERILSRYDEFRAWNPIRAVKAHYFLGLAYEKSGWNKKAIEQYGTFLDIWKAADPGIPEIEDARQRLAQLKGAS